MKTIGIIGGNGKMGQYFADFFQQNGYKVIVSDKGTKLNNTQLAAKADVVIISVPIGVTKKVINEIAPYVKKDGLLMDITSLKVFSMEAMKKVKGSYLGCHPLFGPSTSIGGQMIILCKGRGDKWYQWCKNLLKKNKVDVRELTPKKHDNLMAYIQSLTHFSYLALADVLRKSGLDIKDILAYQSPIYRIRLDVMGRILNQDPDLYAQIQIQNPNSLKVMNDLMSLSKEWVGIVEKKDVKEFKKRFSESSEYFGNFKKLAMEESDFLIEQMNRRKLMEKNMAGGNKPDKTCDIAVLGPENTFSGLAAKKYNPKAKIWYADFINEVFDAVKHGVIKKGIVPADNNVTGSVAEAWDNLFESDLKIQEEFYLPIHHCLAALNKIDWKKIKTIYSHAQPVKQCREYLKKHFPKASVITMPSSVSAIKKLIADNCYDAAVICSKEAAQDFQMTVLAENIEDYKVNATRFLVIGKQKMRNEKIFPDSPSVILNSFQNLCCTGSRWILIRRGGQDDKEEMQNRIINQKSEIRNKTSIAFYFSADAPGSLYKVLGKFAKFKVNMTKIESAANHKVPGGHVFYIDFEGSTENPNIKKMLSGIRKHVKKLKILGCFRKNSSKA